MVFLSPQKRSRLIHLTLAILIAAVYAQTLGYGFLCFDDDEYVRDHMLVRQGLTFQGILQAFTTSAASNWHPITWISLMVDTELARWAAPLLARVSSPQAGLFPVIYHFTNVLLHAINAMLLFAVLRDLTGSVWRSAMVAALFALHPMHVESVAWIAERKDVLSMFFLLLTIRAYREFVQLGDIRSYVMVVTYFALGIMSKPMLVTLPCILLLLDWWPLQRWQIGGARSRFNRWLVIEKLPLVAISIVTALVTMHVQVGSQAIHDGVRIALSERLAIAAVSYVRYLGKLFWPTDLAVMYPNPAHLGREFFTTGQVVASVTLLAIITIAAFLFGRSRRYLIIGWLWFMGTLVPVIGLVQIGRHSLADRYAYIPYLGLYIAVIWLVGQLLERVKGRAVVQSISAAVVLLALAATTFQQVQVWRDSHTLFTHAIRVTENNWVAHAILGMDQFSRAGELQHQGEALPARALLEDAIANFEAAVIIAPDVVWLRDMLADAYEALGQQSEAHFHRLKALELAPDRSKSNWAMAMTLSKRGEHPRALALARASVELDPNSAEAHFALALTLAAMNQFDEAIQHLERAFELDSHLARRSAQVLRDLQAARQSEIQRPMYRE